LVSNEELLEKSKDGLMREAAGVRVLAKTQRKSADQLHESAHKLETLSGALEDGATAIEAGLKRVRKSRATRG
jgi:hypothetical protein